MSTENVLNKIREACANNTDLHCPKCEHALTIEETNFFTIRICENCFEYSRVIDRLECCKTPTYIPVKQLTTSGSIQVKEQCQNCGNVKASAIGGYSKEQKEALPILNTPLRELRYTMLQQQYQDANKKVHEGRSRLYEQKREDRRSNWLEEYSKYLSSPVWRNKRDLVLKRDNYLCQACLKNYATQVHHKSYEFVDLAGSEPAFDLVAICTPCHERIEKLKEEKRKSNNA
jgi:5-methylcytosine-specific restriction endonuclease McrA